MSKTTAPGGLDEEGAALWRKVTVSYALRADELVTLESACRATDRIVRMRDQLGDQVITTGSMGQVVVHPLVAEIRAHEAQVTSLLARLKLPDLPADGAGSAAAPGAEGTRSTSARAAAQTRWGQAHGAGA